MKILNKNSKIRTFLTNTKLIIQRKTLTFLKFIFNIDIDWIFIFAMTYLFNFTYPWYWRLIGSIGLYYSYQMFIKSIKQTKNQ